MKVFITLTVVALVAGGALAFPNVDQKKAKNIVDECNKEGKVSMEQLKKIKQGDLTDADENVKCLAKCFFEAIGFLKDGVVQEDVIIAKFGKDSSTKVKLKKILNACMPQSGASKCEEAFNVLTCWMKEAEANEML